MAPLSKISTLLELAGRDGRVLFTRQYLCLLKERSRHLVDGGRAKGDEALNDGREVGGR